MTVVNNRGEGMTFIIDNNNLDKMLKIKKYYPKASIKIKSNEPSKNNEKNKEQN